MRNLLLGSSLALMASFAGAHPQEGLDPEGLLRYYIKVFNQEDIGSLEDVYHFPNVKSQNGQLVVQEGKGAPIDYEALKKSGWKYSKVNSIKTLSEGSNSALLELDYSRYDANDKEYLRRTGFYVLTKNAGYWQILIDIGAPANAK
jgi:meiotically up-regulated gene 157 (Mug157) protein